MNDKFNFDPSERRAVLFLACVAVVALIALIGYDAVANKKHQDEVKAQQEFYQQEIDSLKARMKAQREQSYKNRRNNAYGKGTDRRYGNGEGRRYGNGSNAYDARYSNDSNDRNGSAASGESGERGRGENYRNQSSNKFTSLTKVDVNVADTALLKRIPGIGEVIAAKIIEYREKLGGYNNVNQLFEVKFFTPDLLKWFVVNDAPSLRQLNLNIADFRTVNNHPYITYEQTKAIMNYRRIYGEIKDVDQLRSTSIFTDEQLEKLLPYISFTLYSP